MSFFKRKSKSPSPSAQPSNIDTYVPPPPIPIELDGYSQTTKNRLMSTELAEDIRNILPMRYQVRTNWHLVYSLEQHGASLHTLYRMMKPLTRYDKNGYILVIRDLKNSHFGCFVNEYLHPTDLRRFYGNGECFLWKSKRQSDDVAEEMGGEANHIQFKAFPYTGLNDFIIYCTSEFLSLGGGDGHYGLWCDADLMTGVSDQSLTFGNEPLSEEGTKFNIIGLEVWRVG